MKLKHIANYALALTAFASMTIFTGCSKDEEIVDPVPTITIDGGSAITANVGDTVSFNVAVVADAKIKSIETKLNGTVVENKTADFKNPTSDAYMFSYIPTKEVAGETLEFTITVMDKKDRPAQKMFTIAVAETGTVRTQSTVLLYGQGVNGEGSFYSTEGNGMVYEQADAKANSAKIDLLYFFGSENKATLAAPADADAKKVYNSTTNGLQTWSKLNATKFKEVTMTTEAFNTATFESLAAAAEGATVTKINKLGVGKYLAFVTEGGKKGVIYVKSITGETTGKIELDIKIQGEAI